MPARRRHRARARRRSTSTCRSAGPGRTASTTSPPSTRRSPCTTTSPSPAAVRSASRSTGESAELVPDRRDQPGRPGGPARWPRGRGQAPDVDVLHPQGHPGRRRVRRRLGRRRRGAGRPATQLWGLGLSRHELARSRPGLGSDVPFCLAGGTALGTGRGEQLTPVLGGGHYTWVLAVVDGGLSTPEVYAELDRQRERGPGGDGQRPRRGAGGAAAGQLELPGPGDEQRPAAGRVRAAARAAQPARARRGPGCAGRGRQRLGADVAFLVEGRVARRRDRGRGLLEHGSAGPPGWCPGRCPAPGWCGSAEWRPT